MPIPILVWVAIAAAGGIAAYFGSKLLKDLWEGDRRSLGIIGMQRSGKTRFLSFLRNIQYTEKPTGKEKYSRFDFTTASGKVITILEGVDIGGGEQYRSDYKEIIEKNDVIFYFFDVEKYLKGDLSYERECNSRFDFVVRALVGDKKNDWKNILEPKDSKKKLVFFATHKDKLNLKDDEIIKRFGEKIKGKWYADLDNFTYPINTIDTNELKEVTDKIFK